MSLFLDWGNLWAVALPLSIALTVSAILGYLLARGAERARSAGSAPGRTAVEPDSLREDSARVSIALLIFVATGTFAVFAYGFPNLMLRYVLPFNLGSGQLPSILLAILFVVNLGAALALAIYLVQGIRLYREWLARGAAVAALVGVVAGASAGGIGELARAATPVALAALVLVLATEHRARMGGALFGIRTVGLSTFPLFFVSGLAVARIVEVVRIAG